MKKYFQSNCFLLAQILKRVKINPNAHTSQAKTFKTINNWKIYDDHLVPWAMGGEKWHWRVF